MKKAKIIFWISTGLIFVFEGVMPALFGQSEMSIQGFTHLGYPVYFVTLMTIFKVLGVLALVIPAVPARVKEWAYAGFGFDFLCAFISICIVDGLGPMVAPAVIAMVLLVLSYINYHKLNS
ncbi:MAG: DoxX family protein [Candidatus Nomurabacteria bacterium]|nr:DoxX family protein [Candidatus Nomurabacteria bacterium]